MNIKEELNRIQIEMLRNIKECVELLKRLYPLNSVEFMTKEEKEKYDRLNMNIRSLADQYDGIYLKIPFDERYKYPYDNYLGRFNKTLREMGGLEMVYNSFDEYDLQRAFGNAKKEGMKALDALIKAEKENDYDVMLKSRRILDACREIFKGHFWGEGYQEDLDKYEDRLRDERTNEDDLRDYELLYEEARVLTIEYAKDLINGINDELLTDYYNRYQVIFEKEQDLLRFLPVDVLRSLDTNRIHWMKVDAERDPEKFLREINGKKAK